MPLTRTSKVLSSILGAALLSGCESMRPIVVRGPTQPPPTAESLSQLRIDDVVRVALVNGDLMEFRVAVVENDALVAKDGRRFLYSDIMRVEKSQISVDKTVALGFGMMPLVGVLIGVLALAAGR